MAMLEHDPGNEARLGAAHSACGQSVASGCSLFEGSARRIKAGAQRVAQMWWPQGARMRFSKVILEAMMESAERVSGAEPDVFRAPQVDA